MKRLLVCALFIAAPAFGEASYDKRPEVRSFIREMVKRHGFVESELRALFARVERAEPVLTAIRKPPEPPVWADYRALFLTDQRIEGGVQFWQAHRAVLERGCQFSGCTVHYVDDEYDHGPILLQRCVPVHADDTVDSLAARVFEAELEAYPAAVRAHFARSGKA